MFVVERVLSRGFFRDKVLVVAKDDASLSRRRLGWDLLGAPDVTIEHLSVLRGQEFVVSLPKRAITEGHQISAQQAAEMRGFDALWKPAVA